MKFGIFLSDASFDHKTKVSVVGIREITTGETFQFINANAKNPTNAEIYGINKAMITAGKEGFDNVVFICDNKSAIVKTKKDFFTKEELRSQFWYCQFLWLPRDYLANEDFLSKNISKEMEVELIKHKKRKTLEQFNSFEEKHITKHINDINISDEVKNESVEKRINQFVRLKEGDFKSKFFKEIDLMNPEELSSLLIEDIELIEEDLKNIKDPFLKAIGKTILDMLIAY